MTSFTFTSEDLERVNKDKKQDDKVFNQLENVRIAPGLMNKDGVTINWTEANSQFLKDATRGTPTILKQGNNSTVIFGRDTFNPEDSESAKNQAVNQQIFSLKTTHGFSDTQINDVKFMTNQANIAAMAGNVHIYKEKILPDEPEKIQYDSMTLAHLEITTPPQGQPSQLIYSTAAKITFDKSLKECNYKAYEMGAVNDISTKDNLTIVVTVNLGDLGSNDYTPRVTCSLYAEGKMAEQVLSQIKQDINITSNQNISSYQNIKDAYEEIVVQTLKNTGYEAKFYENVKQTIDNILSGKSIEPSRLPALKEFKSTPKLFAEVLVDRISEINNITDHKEHAQAMKQLSDNAAQFVDQPKGYMKVLINDTAKEMAKEGNINLPKQGIISKISHNIELMLAKINVKIHGKSPQLKEHKELITQARVQTQQKQNTGYSR